MNFLNLVFSLITLSKSLPLYHLPRDLQQLMRGAESPFPHFAKHLREFEQARVAIETFDARQGAVALNELLHLIVFIAKRRKLRKMRHTKDLMQAREIPQFLTNGHTHASADALVNFVEDQGRNFVGVRQHVLQTQHQTRGLSS